MEQEQNLKALADKIDAQESKIDAMYQSVEKLRKYFLWTLWISVALFVLPLIGLLFAIPSFLSSYTGQLQGIETTSN